MSARGRRRGPRRARHRRLARLRPPSVCGIPGTYRPALATQSPADDRPDDHDRSWSTYPIINSMFLAGVQPERVPAAAARRHDRHFMMIFGIMAIGLNIVAGFAGLLDLGYVAFYALGAYTAAFLASPHWGALGISLSSSPTSRRIPGHPPAVLDHRPARGHHRGDVRRAAGRADAPSPRRLPRDRDPRLRRDRAGRVPEPRRRDVQLSLGPINDRARER